MTILDFNQLNKEPKIIVRANGRDIHNLDKGINNLRECEIHLNPPGNPNVFRLTFSLENFYEQDVLINDRIIILIDDTIIMKGLAQDASLKISPSDDTYMIVGTDMTGWFMSNDALPKRYGNTNDNAVIQDIIKQAEDLGLPFFKDGRATTFYEEAKIIKDYRVGIGMSMFDVMQDIAALNDFYIFFDQKGELRKTKLDTITSRENRGVLSMDLTDLDYNDFAFQETRSILSAKSDILFYSTTTSSSAESHSIFKIGNSPQFDNFILGKNTKKAGRKSSNKYFNKEANAQRPDGLNTNNLFRTSDTNLLVNSARPGSTFRRRKTVSLSSQDKGQAQAKLGKMFTDTAPEHTISLAFKHLIDIRFNDLIRLKYRHIDNVFTVRSLVHKYTPSDKSTSIILTSKDHF